MYYISKVRPNSTELENAVIEEFKASKNNYGTRKLKVELSRRKVKIIASRRKIGKIMAKYGLVSNYTIKQFKVHKSTVNQDIAPNLVNREFKQRDILEVVVSDLTYVNVAGKWNYICVLLDIFNREIIGFSAGKNKSSDIVRKAFCSVKTNLSNISIFHTDRGSEFKNNVIDNIINTFGISRSLSRKGNPWDNSVAEATFKIIKTEFAFNKTFSSFSELEYLLFDYVNWFNNIRIHGSLGYLSPIDYKSSLSDKKLS